MTMERIVTPWDVDPTSKIVQTIDAASTIRFMIYGINIPDIFSALERAYTRGADIKGIFDSGSTGDSHEKAQLRSFFRTVPQSLFRIGTSPSHGQIVHLKCLYTDFKDGVAIPDTTPKSVSGSFNFTTEAHFQVNNVDINDDLNGVAVFDTAFTKLWTWIDQNQKQPDFSTVSLKERLMGVFLS